MNATQQTKILSNAGYFEQFRQALQATGSPFEAWQIVETELYKTHGLRRFRTYGSLKSTVSRLRSGKTAATKKIVFYSD